MAQLFRIYKKHENVSPIYTSSQDVAAQAAISGNHVSVTDTEWYDFKVSYTPIISGKYPTE